MGERCPSYNSVSSRVVGRSKAACLIDSTGPKLTKNDPIPPGMSVARIAFVLVFVDVGILPLKLKTSHKYTRYRYPLRGF